VTPLLERSGCVLPSCKYTHAVQSGWMNITEQRLPAWQQGCGVGCMTRHTLHHS